MFSVKLKAGLNRGGGKVGEMGLNYPNKESALFSVNMETYFGINPNGHMLTMALHLTRTKCHL